MNEKHLHKSKTQNGMIRIIDRRDYLSVAAAERKWVTSSFVLQMRVLENCDDPVAVGFTTSRKVGNAVARNKARRRLKEAARIVFTDKTFNGHQFIFIARTAAVDYPFDKMQDDMRWASKKLMQGADLMDKTGDEK